MGREQIVQVKDTPGRTREREVVGDGVEAPVGEGGDERRVWQRGGEGGRGWGERRKRREKEDKKKGNQSKKIQRKKIQKLTLKT